MRKWRVLLAAFLLLCLSACSGGEDGHYLFGRVTQVQRAPDGSLSALVLCTGDGEQRGVFLGEETGVDSVVEDALTGEAFLDQAPLGTVVSVYLRPDIEPRPITAPDGTALPDAGTADYLIVEEARSPDLFTLSDGTQGAIWTDGWGRRSYRLPNGTELLQESPPETDFSTYCVEGDTPLSALSPALLDGLQTYYRARGPLYDLQAELERAYAGYQSAEDPERFSSFRVGQRVEWAATAPGVYYFQTTVTLPVREQVITEYTFTDAFDRETGAHVPNEALFTHSRDRVRDVLIDQMDVSGTEEAELRESFQWSCLNFQTDRLELWYPAGSLPSEEHTCIQGLDYGDIADILQPWAVPEDTADRAS